MSLTLDLASANSRIDTIVRRYPNSADHVARQAVALNLANHQPAFWCTASFSAAAIGILAEACNRLHSVRDGIDECGRIYRRDHAKAAWLDYLIPLNDASVKLLAEGYEHCGTFRTNDELYARMERAESHKADRAALNMGDAAA